MSDSSSGKKGGQAEAEPGKSEIESTVLGKNDSNLNAMQGRL